MKATAFTTVTALALVLASCGGGEGGGSTGGGGSSPSPTPTTSPTPSPTSTPIVDNGRGTISTFAPFGVEADTAMAFLGLVSEDGKSRWLDEADMSLTWLSGPRTFAMTLLSYGSGQVIDDPDNQARSGTFLADANQVRLAHTIFYIPGNPRSVDNFTLLGFFGPPTEQATGPGGAFLYYAKASISPPTTGQVKYIIGQSLNQPCPAAVVIDFQQGTVTGDVCLTYEDGWGPYPPSLYPIENGTYDRQTGKVSARFTVPGSGMEGEMRAQVIGSGGRVLALVSRGAVYNFWDEKFEEAWRLYSFEDERSLPVF